MTNYTYKKCRNALTTLFLLATAPTAALASAPPISVPEPSVLSLLGIGVVAAIIGARYKRNK